MRHRAFRARPPPLPRPHPPHPPPPRPSALRPLRHTRRLLRTARRPLPPPPRAPPRRARRRTRPPPSTRTSHSPPRVKSRRPPRPLPRSERTCWGSVRVTRISRPPSPLFPCGVRTRAHLRPLPPRQPRVPRSLRPSSTSSPRSPPPSRTPLSMPRRTCSTRCRCLTRRSRHARGHSRSTDPRFPPTRWRQRCVCGTTVSPPQSTSRPACSAARSSFSACTAAAATAQTSSCIAFGLWCAAFARACPSTPVARFRSRPRCARASPLLSSCRRRALRVFTGGPR
jgi:hypothetical protein